MFENHLEEKKISLIECEAQKNRGFYPVKEEETDIEEKTDIYGENLGNYIDKLNSDIEKLKQNFEGGSDYLDERHKKNIPSISSNSEFYEQTYSNLKIAPQINFSKYPIHNRTISFDPKNIIQAKKKMEIIEECINFETRQSVLDMNDKLEDFPERMRELERQNNEIKEFLLIIENDKLQLQDDMKKLALDQKNNVDLIANMVNDRKKLAIFQKKLIEENSMIENERKEFQRYVDLKLEDIKRKEDSLDLHLKIKANPNLVDKRNSCPCNIF